MKKKLFPLALSFVMASLLFTSCSRERKLSLNLTVPSLIDFNKKVNETIEVSYQVRDEERVKYSNVEALKYAKLYAKQNNNSCGVYNDDPTRKLSDCAHFIAHCLKAGGITIKAQTPDLSICPDGLCFRVVELIVGLDQLSNTATNVKKIKFEEAITGDYAFFRTLVRPSHALMVCNPAANVDDFTIYSHTTNRNCEKASPKFYQYPDIGFRMEDGN